MNKKTIKFIFKYLKKHKYKYIVGTIIILVASILSILTGYLSGVSVEKVTIGNYKLAIIIMIIFFLCCMLKSFLRKYSNILFQKISNDVMEEMSYGVFYKVGLLPARAFEERTSGELINRVTSDSTNIVSNFNNLIWLFSDFVAVLLISIYILFNSWIVFLEVVIYLIVFYLFTKKYMPIIKDIQKDIKKDIDKTTSKVNESIRGVREIRALGIREKINSNVKKDISNVFKKRKENINFTESYYATVRNINNVFESGIYLTCIILLLYNSINLTFFIAMTWYVYRFIYLFESFTGFSTNFQTLKVSAERIMELLDNKLYKDITFGNYNKDVVGNITFKNVTFKYKEDENNVLKDFNIEIKNNKITALVGKSGGGKTTIFNLLLRYFDPQEGVILIDDKNIKEFSEKCLQKNIAIIRQDPFLFNISILDNFRILNEKISLQKVRHYCKLCEIDDYIMSLPNKYNTIIGEGGINLSGGQKQRIAIARALMKETKIILLDEATSALDNISQEKIKKVINKLSKDHTIVIVAHRLSTIVDAEEICFINNGKVQASGTHDYLLKNSKEYKRLYLNDMFE